MVYWVKVPSSAGTVQTAGIQTSPALASAISIGGETIQISPGNLAGQNMVGGVLVNPETLEDQGISVAEVLYVDFTGPAYSYETGTTTILHPGEAIDLPANTATWVNAATGGHQFTAVLYYSVSMVTLPTDITVQGSLHYDSAIDMREDAVVDSNTVVFTALDEVQSFNEIGPDYLYIATYDNIRFAFSSRGRLYEQADLYHYLGKAIYSTSATQVIDDINTFNPTLVVSNSLPIWIAMNGYVPPYGPDSFSCPFPLYPSFLVTDNLVPPFGSVHIEDTEGLHTGLLGPRLQGVQLCRDRVRVTMYGADNTMAWNFRDFVTRYSTDWNTIGYASLPVIKDVKHTQPELKILSQRKQVDFTVNYLQSVSRNIARQFILNCIVQNQAVMLNL
jgi:hypothetical protein